ncbi:uncharacterized protein [Spinacia oleracea]|uniref:SWIM-type domain-containing protein n=1 Tax=Spinacia oleracea TaxID=3562 RepID=A0A9R0IV79_SPIOL|nr:uncharacterized protein LOC110795537 [Spinacia oleracea]
MKRAKRVTGVELGYYKCYNARLIAMQMIHGDSAEEYKRVWDYAKAIRMHNPGSTVVVKVVGIDNPPPLFQRMYICLQPCKEGFMAGCRPILGVDGCHLRGSYPGICLTAVGKDGNNNIFPVAWAVVEVENADTWAWFLDLLVKDLDSVKDSLTWVHEKEEEGEADKVTYMSDRQKGLLDAFNKVVPNAEIRFCCRHIWANFKLKFPGELYRECFWKAARSSTKWHFDSQMESIKLLSVEAYKYLNGIPPCHWSRHAFSTKSKSGMLLNNCCESFNNVIRDARSKPILSMMEWLRRYVMKRCCAKRNGLKKFEGVVMPSVVKMIDRASDEVSKCDVTQADVHEFEVDHISTGESYVVNLVEKRCGCYRWELMGIPCYHALACIVKQRLNVEDFVHQAYHVSTYARTYAPAFHPMPGKHQWPTVNLAQPLPPPFRKMPGRPKGNKRIKEKGEGEERELVIRTKKANKCGNCGGTGHFKKTCKNPPMTPPNAPKSKGGRPRKRPLATALYTAPTVVAPANVPPLISAPAAPCKTKKKSTPTSIPKPKKHKSIVDVLSSQTNTSCNSKTGPVA